MHRSSGSDPDVQHGSERWIRTKWNSVQKYRDGLTIDAFGLPPVATAIAKMMSVRMLRWASSRSIENGYSKLMLSAPLIGFCKSSTPPQTTLWF